MIATTSPETLAQDGGSAPATVKEFRRIDHREAAMP